MKGIFKNNMTLHFVRFCVTPACWEVLGSVNVGDRHLNFLRKAGLPLFLCSHSLLPGMTHLVLDKIGLHIMLKCS